MPDYTVLVRVSVRETENPKTAAHRAYCYLFDDLAGQTAIVQDNSGTVVGTFAFTELDDELIRDAEFSNADSVHQGKL